MKILFLTIAFPDLRKSQNLYTDLVKEFYENGHETFPIAPSQDGGKTQIMIEDSISVLRVKTFPLFPKSTIIKSIANISLPFQYLWAVKKYYRGIKFDLIIWPTPTITLYIVAKYIKKKYGSKLYFILRDIFPHDAADVGIFKRNGIFFNYFRNLEKKVYNLSDGIGCMSQGNIDFVLKHNPDLDKSKLNILHNFQKIEPPYQKDEKLKEKYGLYNKFVMVFGGNMGTSQKLENVLELAKRCEKYFDVIFLIIGGGTQREYIEKLINKFESKNVIIKDLIPRGEYKKLVASCDVGIISLNEILTTPNIPSKAMAYFEAGIPILASLDYATDFDKMLQDTNSGLSSKGGQHQDFMNNFDKLYKSKELREEMGLNGRKLLEECMTTQVAYNEIIKFYDNIVK